MSDILARELTERSETREDDDLFDASAFSDVRFELSYQLKNMIRKLSQRDDLPSYPVSKYFHGTLRAYQEDGLNWLIFLRNCGFGACLADDMGLGKTIQMIAYFAYLKEQGQQTPSLIIAPTSVLGNWRRELETFAPGLTADAPLRAKTP